MKRSIAIIAGALLLCTAGAFLTARIRKSTYNF